MTTGPRSRRPQWSASSAAVVLPLLVGASAIAVTWVLWRGEREHAERAQREYFDYRVRDAQQRIEHRLEGYKNVLRATHGHFLTADVTRDSFRRYVAAMRLEVRYPGIQGVGFVQVVPRDGLEAHLASVRSDGLPSYAVRPADERDPYTSIVLLEPSSGRNLRAFGYDMYTEPVRRSAMDLARDLDEIVASSKVKLIQETDAEVQAGFLMYRPVFAQQAPDHDASGHASTAHAQLRGWVYAPFRMGDFMAGVLGERARDIDIELYDGDALDAASLLYAGAPASPHLASGRWLHATTKLDVGHHSWTLQAWQRPRLAALTRPDRSAAVGWSGAIGALLLAALTRLLATDRRKALALAEEREKRYELMADAAPLLIWTTNAEGRCDYVNAPWLAFTGRTLDQELGEGWTESVHPDDRARCRTAFAAARHSRTPLSREYRLRRADGRWRWVLDSGVPRTMPDGSFAGYVGSCVDLTEHKRVQDELEQLVAEQSIILQSANVAIIMVVDGKQVAVNRGVEDLFGYSRTEMLGETARMYYPSDEAFEAFESEAHAALAEGRVYETERELRRKDGSSVWVACSGKAVVASELSRGTLWVLGDRTARRQMDQAVERERERYRSLMAIAQDGIHVLDADGNLIEANAAFLRMLGLGPEAVGKINVRAWEAQIPPDRLQSTLRALMDRPGLFQTKHRRKDGSLFDVEVHAGGVELEGTRYLLATSRDITARREFEQTLASKQAELEEMNRSLEHRVAQGVTDLRARDELLITQSRLAAMGEMLGNISHQWRQPLNALGLLLFNIRDASRFGDLDRAAVERSVEHGNRLIQKMSSTINDFRDFIGPEKAKVAFSAVAQVRETLGLFDASLRLAGGDVEVEVEVESDVVLVGFPNEYSQVLLNLLANARQAIQATAPAQGRLTIRVSRRGDQGCLTVRDNGGGIDADILGRIFEPYFSTKKGGTGIGLYMSRKIVEQSLGGTLEVRNVDAGAEFTIVAPLAQPEQASAVDAAPVS